MCGKARTAKNRGGSGESLIDHQRLGFPVWRREAAAKMVHACPGAEKPRACRSAPPSRAPEFRSDPADADRYICRFWRYKTIPLRALPNLERLAHWQNSHALRRHPGRDNTVIRAGGTMDRAP